MLTISVKVAQISVEWLFCLMKIDIHEHLSVFWPVFRTEVKSQPKGAAHTTEVHSSCVKDVFHVKSLKLCFPLTF